jgi:Domain of unknown function (DUF4286)
MVVQSGSAGDSEEAYNQWYRETHIPQILGVEGFVSARRYRLNKELTANSTEYTYITIYEIEGDDLQEPLTNLATRAASGGLDRYGDIEWVQPPVTAVYELQE